jgi:hypothetical protein
MVFPDDAIFHKLKQSDDRVYSLKFQSSMCFCVLLID